MQSPWNKDKMATASWAAHLLLPEQNQDDCYSQAVPHGPGEQRQDGGEVLLSQPSPGPGKTGKQRGQNKTRRASLFESTGGCSGLCCQNADSYDGGVGSGSLFLHSATTKKWALGRFSSIILSLFLSLSLPLSLSSLHVAKNK